MKADVRTTESDAPAMKTAEGDKQKNMSTRRKHTATDRFPDAVRGEPSADPMDGAFWKRSPQVAGTGFMARLDRAPLAVSRNR